MPQRLLALAAIALVITGGALAVDEATRETGDRITVSNETFTPSAGTIQSLNDSEISGAVYDRDVFVIDENDTALDASGNYTWYDNNGTIEPLTGGELDGDANATIDYNYSTTSDFQSGANTVMSGGMEVLGVLLWVLLVGFLLMGVGRLTAGGGF